MEDIERQGQRLNLLQLSGSRRDQDGRGSVQSTSCESPSGGSCLAVPLPDNRLKN